MVDGEVLEGQYVGYFIQLEVELLLYSTLLLLAILVQPVLLCLWRWEVRLSARP